MSEVPDTPPAEATDCKVDIQDTVKLVSEQNMPLEVGSIEIDEGGAVRARDSGAPMTFSFSFRGIVFDAQVCAGEDAPLQLTATIGQLPYTAENGWSRQAVKQLVEAAAKMRRNRLTLTENDQLVLKGEAVPPAPRTPMSVMATVTSLVIEAKPYLEMLVEALAPTDTPQSAAP